MIYVVFRIAKNYNCKLSTLITYNYLAASLLGLLLFRPFQTVEENNISGWIPYGILLGILFILMFFLIGLSSQKTGITVTTLANKLSLVFPVLFSLIFFDEETTTVKLTGLITATLAVGLTLYKKDIKKTNILYILLPMLIFFGSGLVDSIVKYVQAVKISDNEAGMYSMVVFFTAFLCGVVIMVFSRNTKYTIHFPTVILGILLGTVNFGSLYFIIRALNTSNLESSMVFALNNMSIVALTAMLGTILFKERLNKINFAGIVLAIVSLYFLL
jgi:drug/metabolite transporter (DMT)-like permease